jgi:hypothetical protein
LRRRLAPASSLLLAATVGAGVTSASFSFRGAAYAPAAAESADTLRVRLVEQPVEASRAGDRFGAVVPGYLSRRGLPPIQGRFTLSHSGLVFRSRDGFLTRFPLVGPVREAAGRKRRASTVALAYVDETGGRPAYVFRIDAGVFETDEPGPLLHLASHPVWLDSVAASEWIVDQPLVRSDDSTALWATARGITSGPYADSLYALFGSPRAAVGLMGRRGRRAGRLGEYIGTRDSLALDPGRMVNEAQLRHTVAHELGHRWQSRAPSQITTLWREVAPIRDPRRYGYGNTAEQQAEAVAFAVDFLQTTARRRQPAAISVMLLDHYELLVPGTRIMVRYLALQPLYRRHPLRAVLTTGRD